MNNLNKEQKSKIIGVVLYVAFIIIMNISFFTKYINKSEVTLNGKVLYITLAAILTMIIGFLIIFIKDKKNIKPEKAFVILATILGTVNMLATPLLRGHDEEYHWYKAYAVSMGQFVQGRNEEGFVGDYLPAKVSGIYEVQGNYKIINFETSAYAWKYARDDRMTNDIKFTYNEPTSMYPPIQMIPQATGIFIARTIGLDVYMQAMFGRIFNLIFFIIMGYLAIKILPRKKYFLVILLLCPKVLYISSTMSGDVFINMTAILFTSYIFKLRAEKKLLTKKDILILLILVPCIAVSKLVYFALSALVLLIPRECFKGKKEKGLFIYVVVMITIISMATWIGASGVKKRPEDANMQREWIIEHPISYLGVMIRGVCDNFGIWMLDMVGGAMAWHTDVNEPQLITIIACIVLILALLQDESEDEKYKISEYVIIILSSLIVVAGVITALYLEWTARRQIGGTDVTGVQGRYFTPLALLLASIIPTKYLKSKNKIDVKWLYIMMILCQFPTIMNILIYYI